MDFLKENKIIILRTFGSLLLILGFMVHYWNVEQKNLSENDKAALRVARMEAHAEGLKDSTSQEVSKKGSSEFLSHLKKAQKQQLEYFTIVAMILGVGFLGYTFIPTKK